MSESGKRTITARDLYQLQLISSATISPDGVLVLFVLHRTEEKRQKAFSNLWIVNTRAQASPRQFTYGDQVDSQPRWSPDGRQIAFVSNRADKEQPQIYIIPIDGGEARPLTDLQGSFGEIAWSPDGTRLAFSFRKKDAEVIEREKDETRKELGVVERHIRRLTYKADGEGFLPEERWHIWLVDVTNGQTRQLTEGAQYDEGEPDWSPDGSSILFRSNRSTDPDLYWDQDDLYLIPADGGEMRRIEAPPGPKMKARFAPDGRHIVYIADAPRHAMWQNPNLMLVAVDGSSAARNLTDAADMCLGQKTTNDTNKSTGCPPVWSADGQTVYVQASEHGRTILKAIDVESGEMSDVIDGPGVVAEFSLDKSETRLAYLYGSISAPAQLWLKDSSESAPRQLSHFNESWLQTVELGRVEELWYKGPDKNDLQGWIIKPPGFDPAKQYPSILEIHGGPMGQYGHYFMHEFFNLAAQGYVVYYTNPRGGAGYGEAHTRAIYDDWGRLDFADLMAWADYVEGLPYIDPERMGVTGGSYGGFMTNWIIGHTQRFKAAVTQRSVSNFISMAGSSDLGVVWDDLFGASRTFWEDMENFWRQSPLKYIGNAVTPTLVIHSEEDYRCHIEQGEQIYVALKRLGVDTELIRFPSESHGLSRGGRTDRRIARLNHILRWFDRYLKAV